MSDFDFRHPNYAPVYEERRKGLAWLRAGEDKERAEKLSILRAYYASNPWDFVSDWGVTYDPRNITRNLPTHMPFVLWPRQREMLEWLYEMWMGNERGLLEKSRDCGVTWLIAGFGVCMWLFREGFYMGLGSRKEDLVDKRGDDKSIFEKTRFFIDNLPGDFLPAGFDNRAHFAHMRITNPETGAAIIGEAGDQIGRGGRTSLYVVDEAAFIEHQDAVDSALSQNTDCQIDVSTPNGQGNAFARKRAKLHGTKRLFIFDWKSDPRKDGAWYAKQKDDHDPVIVAREIDRDYNASQADTFLPGDWVAACIDAHELLGFEAEGIRVAGFDPADTGDPRGLALRHGSVLLEAVHRKEGDITDAIPWAYSLADEFRADLLAYDGDGMGAPVMKTAFGRKAGGRMSIVIYRGSAGVVDPDMLYGEDRKVGRETQKKIARRGEAAHTLRTNRDMFLNFRAQSWTWVRDRCKATFDAVSRARAGKLVNADPENLISISSKCKNLTELLSELSMPKRVWSKNGKIQVETKPDMKHRGVPSGNLADAVVIAVAQRANQALQTFRPRGGNGRGNSERQRTVEQWEPSIPGLGL